MLILESMKTITAIYSVQVVILSSQLKEILMNVNSQVVSQGMYKLWVFYVWFFFQQPEKITAVFLMCFKDKIEVVIETSFFQVIA